MAQDILSRLKETWQGLDTDIVTAEIKYLSFDQSTMLPSITEDELRQRVNDTEFSSVEDVRAFLRPLAPELPSDVDPFSQSLLVIDGGRKMAKRSHPHFSETVSQQGATEVRAWDTGTDTQRYRQANIGIRNSTPFSVGSLADVRFIPHATAIFSDGVASQSPGNEEAVQVSVSHPGEKTTKSIVLTAMKESGLVTSYQKTVAIVGKTTPYSSLLILQGPPLPEVSEAVIPAWKIEASFRHGVAERIKFTFIQSAKINSAIPDERFSVSIPADTVVVDSRQNIEHPKVSKTEDTSEDVIEFADSVSSESNIDFQPAHPESSDVSEIVYIVVAFSVGCVLMLAYYFFKRAQA